MSKKKSNLGWNAGSDDDEDAEVRIRQCVLVSLNESVSLLSNYDADTMEVLTNRAIELLSKIKDGSNHG
jgi:hypothetical protein